MRSLAMVSEYFRLKSLEVNLSANSSTGTFIEKPDAVPRRNARYLLSAAPMIGSFFAGVALAVAHHVYYARLNDTVVGSTARQQWPIRVGAVLAFLVQVCLSDATNRACTQWVWRQCHQRVIRIESIDAAFSVNQNLFTLLNPDFVRKFPMVAILAVVFCTGNLLPMSPLGLGQNISYTIPLNIPVIRCRDSNETIRSRTALAAMLSAEYYGYNITTFNTLNLTFTEKVVITTFNTGNLAYTEDLGRPELPGEIGYFGTLGFTQGLGYIDVPELWIAIAAPPQGNGTSHFHDVDFYTCNLWNASVTTKVAFTNNLQSLQVINIGEVPFAHRKHEGIPDRENTLFNGETVYQLFANLIFRQAFRLCNQPPS
ncbi:hypothetical protein BU23DRAFT_604394 [Bimuria novae-zelandiae CBS 107.79]|uniref:Uncharacterized protein n=1 Tax=Bimuria novae-zelandiae CBS 107.79 TaxID=1447943 RepID=A0A6A5UVN0_9PLEO|nr:hypothetical protein BU23DRAFT_604394 [Bimuria novae-zelandiae CBS 107.79]